MSTPKGLPRRGAALYKEDWDSIIAACRKKPGEVGKVLEDRPVSRAKSANTRRTAPFVQQDGRLRVRVRNSRWVGDTQYADLYCVWEPTS